MAMLKSQMVHILVGGLEHEFYDFPYIGNVIIPTDFHIFQRGRYTTNQIYSCEDSNFFCAWDELWLWDTPGVGLLFYNQWEISRIQLMEVR